MVADVASVFNDGSLGATATAVDGDALAKGAVICVDPRLSNTAAKAQEWLPIKPGTPWYPMLTATLDDATATYLETVAWETWQDVKRRLALGDLEK